MPAGKLSISAAVEIAWRIAAASARTTGGVIELPHFLYGVFSLDRVDAATATLNPDSRSAALDEITALQRELSSAAVRMDDVRRRIRDEALTPVASIPPPLSSSSSRISRSTAVREAFECAASRSAVAAHVGLLSLTQTLLVSEPRAVTWLGLQPEAFKALLTSLAAMPPPPTKPEQDDFPDLDPIGTSIFQILDAEAVSDGDVNWSIVGKPFGALCELAWQAGTSTRVEPLLDASVEILRKAIPAAEHFAILMLDDGDELILKAHAPRGAMPVSNTSAMKAIHQRNSFIWERGADLSASQLEGNLCAGLYAPILAAGEVFGVLCLDVQSAASRFTPEDLYLVTSLGHQLGLTMANRRREEDLCRTAQLMERLLTSFSPQVRERLLSKAESGHLKLGGERSVISILCSDLRDFTRLTAKMDADDVVNMLNDYFSAMVAVVFRYGGSVDKFIGASLLAVFGSPEADAMHAEKSVRAATDIQSEAARISVQRKAAGLPACDIGIGVHTGEVIHGFVGSPDRMEFTVVGPPVELATQFCSSARAGEVILSNELLEQVWRYATVEPMQSGTLPAYRLLSMRPPKPVNR